MNYKKIRIKDKQHIAQIESILAGMGLDPISNRKKLHDYIASTGFTAKDLSLVAGKSQTFLSGESSLSRIAKRGDISEKRLNELKVIIDRSVEVLSKHEPIIDEEETKKDLCVFYMVSALIFGTVFGFCVSYFFK